ncbi:hypothetical protein LG329_14155 [Virgibacillus necropolis]|uniref:hypothetical protein n=1 Tax=Virgibacillus necropolis TaxID=163877 RepID=UPI00384FB9B0
MRDNNKRSEQKDKSLDAFNKHNLSPQQVAVITALLLNALQVESVLIDKDQTVEVILQGSLRRKTKMDKLLDDISGIPVGDLWDALNRR